MDEALEVQLHVKNLILPGSDWARVSGAGMSGDVWPSSRKTFPVDEAVDPGPKGIKRIKEKVETKYGGKYERNRDYCRLGLIYDSVSHLLEGLEKILKFKIKENGMKVVELENRFARPTSLGWQDISLLLRVRVPSSGRFHVMEIQMQLRRLMKVRDTEHGCYEKIRSLI